MFQQQCNYSNYIKKNISRLEMDLKSLEY